MKGQGKKLGKNLELVGSHIPESSSGHLKGSSDTINQHNPSTGIPLGRERRSGEGGERGHSPSPQHTHSHTLHLKKKKKNN